jgi:hypothetical protein
MFEFLMGPVEVIKSPPFFSCMTIGKAVRIAETNAFIPASTTQSKLKLTLGQIGQHLSTHVTANVLSSSDRMMYKERLKSDPIFGPVLEVVDRILQQAKSNPNIYTSSM